eukprot:scaffold17337_cov98-Isochrysis_galbana.AAC.3
MQRQQRGVSFAHRAVFFYDPCGARFTWHLAGPPAGDDVASTLLFQIRSFVRSFVLRVLKSRLAPGWPPDLAPDLAEHHPSPSFDVSVGGDASRAWRNGHIGGLKIPCSVQQLLCCAHHPNCRAIGARLASPIERAFSAKSGRPPPTDPDNRKI